MRKLFWVNTSQGMLLNQVEVMKYSKQMNAETSECTQQNLLNHLRLQDVLG